MQAAISYAVGFRQSKTALFDWTFFRLDSPGPSSYRQSNSVVFVVVVLFLEVVGVREYCCTEVEIGGSSVHRALSASNGSANPRPSELVALGLAESRYVRGVALSREPPKRQQPQPLLAAWDRDRALLPSCDTRC